MAIIRDVKNKWHFNTHEFSYRINESVETYEFCANHDNEAHEIVQNKLKSMRRAYAKVAVIKFVELRRVSYLIPLRDYTPRLISKGAKRLKLNCPIF